MNKCRRLVTVLGAVAWLSAPPAARAQELPAYRSQFNDAPPARVGQANRGAAQQLRLVVLAPEQKGASASASPQLHWYQSAASMLPLEVVLQERGANTPLIELRIEPAGVAGFHAIDLAAHGIALATGREYEWSVALIVDPANRASDLFSKGVVEYVPGAAITGNNDYERIRAYLAAGYWYDAVAMLAHGIAQHPGRHDLVELRGKLLAGQGLVTEP